MASGGNFGPRLLVMLLGLGVVVLGMYPIRKHYGGVRGVLKKVVPAGDSLSLPTASGIRQYLLSIDEERRKRHAGSDDEVVTTVKLTPGKEKLKNRGDQESGGPGLFSGLLSYFQSKSSPAPGSTRSNPEREVEESGVAKSTDRDNTERARLAPVPAPQPPASSKEVPKRRQMDSLTQKDRQELNQLVDGF